MRKRVVITGLGAVTPIGIGVQSYWEGLLTGRCGIGPITLFDAADYPCRIAAEVKDFPVERFIHRKRARLLSRAAQFGVGSALLCLEDAGWSKTDETARLGIAAGISNSSQDAVEAAVESVQEHGYRRTLPYVLTKCFPHATATEAGLATGFQQEVVTFSTACTAGFNAIGYALEEIRSGRLDCCLCPATDSTLSKYVFAYFCRAGMLTTQNDDPTHASRPFDAKRTGGVLGEGAGCILVEELEHARRRGARIDAELLGFATTGVGYQTDDIPTAVKNGMARSMRLALASAHCAPTSIDYIGCHGVSDPCLDAVETQAIKTVFGEHAYRIPMSSAKGMIGIPQNAAGVLQLIAAIQAIRHDVLPPTLNCEFPDPACDLDYIPHKPRRNRVNRALVLAHGFNGSDAALIVGRLAGP